MREQLTTARRAMLANSAALLAGGAAVAARGAWPAAANPDAELLALCGRAEAIYRRIHDAFPDGAAPIHDDKERMAALEPLYREVEQLSDRIFEMQATSLAGHRARACVVLAFHKSYDFFEDDVLSVGVDGQIIAALIRDLVEEA